MTEVGDLSVTGRSMKVEWQVKDFCNLPKSINFECKSPCFTFCNVKWWLSFYPNGKDKNYNWIAMFLNKKPSSSPLQVAYTLGIRRANGSVLKSIEGRPEFDGSLQGFGTDQLVYRSWLNSPNVLDQEGTLRIYCSARVEGNAVAQSSFENSCESLFNLLLEEDKKQLKEKLLEVTKEKEAAVSCSRTQERKIGSALTEINGCKIEINKLKDELSVVKEEKETALAHIKNIKRVDGALSENLKELLESQYEGDTTVRVENKEFLVHKAILAARSSVFRRMFETDMTEKNNGVVNIEDCEYGPFSDFLQFIYSGEFDIVKSSNALKLCMIADKYNVIQLKAECLEIMSKDLSLESVCDAVCIAALYNDKELLNTATDYFIENAETVLCSPKWLSFVSEYTAIANELLVKIARKSKQ